ncbi:TetR/AcrR family transcriptional regulator [Paenibacillus monticola]|uniref:TetR family transcriptional regulator n=1 Tax=Paenibacillus monticola TaxID=2666075 RepID=A0A7X2H7H9_9BACL|nr:TetR/AcrR family transcriptional regulator [Paenibacillus monticola]MRN54989.1 TetR family transcriptional regulator [Paenibacillus monticola]
MKQAKSNGRSERRDAAENRQRILDVAFTLFELQGVEDVSMNQIAAEAQIGSGTLYRRYHNKSELCMDLIKDSKELLFEDIEVYQEENAARPPAERLRGLLALFIKFKEKNAQLLAGIENSFSSGAQSRTESPLYIELHELVVRLFEEMAAQNGDPQPDSVFRTDMLLTALSSNSYLFQKNMRGLSPESILEQLCQTFI